MIHGPKQYPAAIPLSVDALRPAAAHLPFGGADRCRFDELGRDGYSRIASNAAYSIHRK